MAHVLRLLQGDKRNPTRMLDLAEGVSSGSIFLREGGFAPGPGQQEVIWSGRSGRTDGQRRISSSRDNAHYQLSYDLRGGTAAELGWLQREINRFFQDAGLYEEERQGDQVWIEYRWSDNLDTLPAPVFGQLSFYMQVLAGEVPKWPKRLHTGALIAGNIEEVVAEITVTPYAEGLAQMAGNAVGQLEMKARGLLVPYAMANICENPSFGHATWNNGWTVSNAALKAVQETRGNFTRSLDSAAHLYNLHASVQQFYVTLTLLTASHIISCYAQRVDGEAVTVADIQLWGQGEVQATTFVAVDGGPWYLCYATFEAAEVSSTHGVEVKAGREAIVDDVQIEVVGDFTTPLPFCAGHLIGGEWLGTAHASQSARAAPKLKWVLSKELAGEYTVAGWITPEWTNAGPGMDLCVWEYWSDANNYVRLTYDFTADRFEIAGSRNSVAFAGNGAAQTIAMFANIHLSVVQDVSTIKVYVNGSQDISVSNAAGMPVAGTLALGYSTQSAMALTAQMDGWRIWDLALTATQVDTLYDNELPIKAAYGRIGMAPYLWTDGGDGIFDNVDGIVSTVGKNNWGIIGGVAGEAEAAVQWQIDPPTTTPSRVYWLGRRAYSRAFLPLATLFLDFSGTADVGASSGDAYETDTFNGTGTDSHDFDATVDERAFTRGRARVLARLKFTNDPVDVYPYFKLGASNAVVGKTTRVTENANFLLQDLGDIWVDWPQASAPPTMTAGLVAAESEVAGGDPVVASADFMALLPYPNCRVECEAAAISLAAGDTLVIDGHEAWVEDASDNNSQLYRMEHAGDDVGVWPDNYNYVFLLQGEELTQYDVTDTATVVAVITPRWLLPGGAVA